MKFFNTRGRKKEKFTPIKEGKVSMYNCGPTVYGPQHIGNLRAAVFTDILRRVLEYNDYTVKQVVNITDIGHLTSDADSGEDKMVKGLRDEGLPFTREAMKKLGETYATRYKEDRKLLNIKEPAVFPVASDHVAENIALIEKLEARGFTYETDDGVYFDTSKDVSYGEKLGVTHDDDEDYARVTGALEKKNPRDFALWKKNDELGWDSPWGKGFPGWHIECSAMSLKYLGATFDIHTGGIEHIPIHHTNEIAQSENATGHTMAHFWMHNNWLMIEGEKISKSLGNTIYLDTLTERGFSSIALRYLFLTVHYRSQMNFTWEAIAGAGAALERLYVTIANLPEGGSVVSSYQERFRAHINNDLDTAGALALLWEVTRDSAVSPEDLRATLLDFDQVFALDLATTEVIHVAPDIFFITRDTGALPDSIRKLAEKRRDARNKKDWDTSDALRDEIQSAGYNVRDTEDGTIVVKTSS